MDRVGKTQHTIVAGPFEAAEIAAEDLDSAQLAGLDCVAEPLRSRVETENVADLQNPFLSLREFCQLLGLTGDECDRLFHEHIFFRLKKLTAKSKVRLRGSSDRRSI